MIELKFDCEDIIFAIYSMILILIPLACYVSLNGTYQILGYSMGYIFGIMIGVLVMVLMWVDRR